MKMKASCRISLASMGSRRRTRASSWLFRAQVRQAAVSTDLAWKRFFYILDWLPGEG